MKQVDPEYCDFHVDMRVIDGVMADIREEIQSYGLIEANFPNQVPESFWLLDARETPIEILVPYYLLLTQILRDEIDQRGTLICGWWG